MIPLFQVYVDPSVSFSLGQVLGSGQLAEGPIVESFEAALQPRLGAPVLAVNSCTSAIDLALHLVGARPGDGVVTTAMTCVATNVHLLHRQIVPLWADVDRRTGLIDPASVGTILADPTGPDRIVAILAVDWGGAPCAYDELRRYEIPVVEDAAHAYGTTIGGIPLGVAGGDYVCWSFQAIKHLTTGDGGALKVPADERTRARLLRWYGLDRTSFVSFRAGQDIPEAGYKYHMNDVAAAIGLANLAGVDEVLRLHRENARSYHAALADLPRVELPVPNDESAWWLYTILVDDRPSFEQAMREAGIATSPVHARNDRLTCFAEVARRAPTPGLDHFAAREVAIPVGWWLTTSQRDQIVEAVRRWARS
jgi:dTDP-4-amino-4,6-dideoxygalactose transaminase